MEDQPTSTTIRALTQIWERVLGRSGIGLDESFFALGGNPALAAQVFDEITDAFRRELPAEMIYQAPTLAALSKFLEQPAPRLAPAVLIRPGVAHLPAVFLAPGLGGSILEFFELTKHIQTKHPIYGLQTRGMDGIDPPLDRIEDMAEFYRQSIRTARPNGPYILIGYSLGGLVMLELARSFSSRNEKIALLVMLDSYPHIGQLTSGQRLRLFSRLAWRRIAGVPSKHDLPANAQTGVGWNKAPNPIRQRVTDGAALAFARYQPHYYPGKIKFVQAETPSRFPTNAAAVWNGFAEKFECEVLPGDHDDILTVHAQSLGHSISRYLERTLAST